jgi:hypothetical protein
MRVPLGPIARKSFMFATVLGLAAGVGLAADSERQRRCKARFRSRSRSAPRSMGSAVRVLRSMTTIGWGLGFGYNFSEHVSVGMDLTWLSANFDAGVATDLNGDAVPDQVATVSGATRRDESPDLRAVQHPRPDHHALLPRKSRLDLDRLEHPVGTRDRSLLVASLLRLHLRYLAADLRGHRVFPSAGASAFVRTSGIAPLSRRATTCSSSISAMPRRRPWTAFA